MFDTRWKRILCLTLFAATALSFLDRQALSVAAPLVCAEFSTSNEEYAQITTAFLIGYSLMFFLGGRLCDVVGTRLGLGFSVLFWSLAGAACGLATSATQLGWARFFLGVGEGACFPGVAKAVVEWFPKKERAKATGIAIGGVSLGAVVAPPLVVGLSKALGWRGVFFATGFLGLIWAVVWFALYARLERSRSADAALENPEISDEPNADQASENAVETATFRQTATRRDVWGLALARFFFDPVFYLYMFWIPTYLAAERGFTLDAIGASTWIPFFALGVSNIIGGAVSDRAVARGANPVAARKKTMGFAAAATVASGLVAFSPNAGVAIALMAALMFAHGFWITNYIALIGDEFPSGQVATVVGLTGAVGTIGGIFASPVIGWVADAIGFWPIWLASGTLYPLAFLAVVASTRRMKPVEN